MAYAKAAASLSAAASSHKPLLSLELFAGAGGLALGLSRVGFIPQLVTDWDARACATLRANADPPRSYTANWPIRQQDVRRIRYADFDSIDLVSAGAPCQPFSQAGLGLGHQDSALSDNCVRGRSFLRMFVAWSSPDPALTSTIS